MPLLRKPTDEEVRRARLRVWAAEVRDRGGPGAEDAGLLCRLLDLWDAMRLRGRRPDSAAWQRADGLENCINAVVKRLGDAGLTPPGA